MMQVSEARHGGRTEQPMCPVERGYGIPIVSDRFFDMVLKFNLFPAVYVHPDQIRLLEISQGEVPLRVIENDRNPYWLRAFSDALLRSNRLDQLYDFDFSDRGKTLMLLDSSALITLGRHVAAILIQPYLRKIVVGGRVREIDQVMGPACREFGLRWVSRQDVALSQGATSLHGLADAGIVALGAKEDWHEFAYRLILSTLAESDIAVHGRLKLKFSPAWQHAKSFRLLEPARDLLIALFFDVLKTTFPTWHDHIAIEIPGASHAASDLDR